MDRHIDLTVDRDFRQRRVDPSVPRSIFSSNSQPPRTHLIPSVATQINIGTTDGWFSINNGTSTSYTTTNSFNNYQYGSDDTCDRCGKELSRVPWIRELYNCLCKSCSKSYMTKRIPWR